MKEIQSIFLLTLTFFCIMLREHKELYTKKCELSHKEFSNFWEEAG